MAFLTSGAILGIYRSEVTSGADGPLLQVIDIRPIKSGTGTSQQRYRLILSDGDAYQQAMLATQKNDLVTGGKLKQNAIVRLSEFICPEVQNRRIVIVLDLDIVEADHKDKIGAPQNIDTVVASGTAGGAGGVKAESNTTTTATSGSRTTAPPQQQQPASARIDVANATLEDVRQHELAAPARSDEKWELKVDYNNRRYAGGRDRLKQVSEFEESSDSDMEGSRSRDKGSKAKASSPLARDSSSEDGGLPEETVGGGGKRPRTADDAGNMGREDDADSAAASATMPRTQQRSTYESRRDADVHLNLVERVVFTNEELNRAGKGATAHHEGRKEGQHGETMHMRIRTHPLIAAVLPSLSRLSLTPHVHPTFSPPQAAGGQGASTPLMWIDGEWT